MFGSLVTFFSASQEVPGANLGCAVGFFISGELFDGVYGLHVSLF